MSCFIVPTIENFIHMKIKWIKFFSFRVFDLFVVFVYCIYLKCLLPVWTEFKTLFYRFLALKVHFEILVPMNFKQSINLLSWFLKILVVYSLTRVELKDSELQILLYKRKLRTILYL